MARAIIYNCTKCDFYVTHDPAGFSYLNRCVKCEDCGHIGDTTIAFNDRRKGMKDVEPKCRQCDSLNVIEWDKVCPNCGIKVDIHSDGEACVNGMYIETPDAD